MKKLLIWVLILLGIFLLIPGLPGRYLVKNFLFPFINGNEGTILFIGLLLLAIGLFMALGPVGILRKKQVLNTWAVLIKKGNGRAADILQNTELFARESKAPCLGMRKQEIAPGMCRRFLGDTREFLIVTNYEKSNLKPYQIFINARDYGENLDISWYLTYRPTILQRIISLIPFVNVIPETLNDLDIFDQQDLRAYVTNVHSCLKDAVTKLLTELNQDSSKINWESKGFLGIS